MKKNTTNKKNANKSYLGTIDLKKINSPSDIKSMSEAELEYLAIAIREFLIDSVSKTGGHLASNLGTVELTLGLHYVFDSPKDKLIWDVGHQTYIHKILTGRREEFDNMKKTGGISGFPKRKESSHDIYDTGHSSTSIPAALGIATARDLKGDDYEVVAIIGDGSMTGGPALEALNNVGESGTKVIILLNDNGMSISKNIGGISEHLSKLRTSKGYRNIKEIVKDKLDQVPVVGSGLKNVLGNTKENIKYMIMPGGILFEEFGLTYIGPFDGNNIKDVIKGLKQAKNVDGPVLVHMITEKGKGYRPAEENPNKFHGIGSFDAETGLAKSSASLSFSDAFGEAVFNVACNNPNITAITAAMCDATGLGKMQEAFPERVFDVGIAEAYGVIFAAGQAITGLHPIVAIYSSFLQRAYDEMLEDVCLQKLPVTFAIDRAGIVGADGETHHGIFDLTYLIPMPGMTVFAPCDANQLNKMLEIAAKMDSPCAIRYPRGAADENLLKEFDFYGENIRVSSGKDVDILAVGTMLPKALKAAELLREKGIDAGVVCISLVKDGLKERQEINDYILDTQAKKALVTLEDNVVSGGFGEMLNSLYHISLTSDDMPLKVLNLGWPNKFIEHGSSDDLYEKYGLNPKGIAESIYKLINNTGE